MSRLAEKTWTDVRDRTRPILVVPVGSCEQHGPHLPVDTDTRIAVALADALAQRDDGCVVTPPLTITASGEHQGFPGTLSIGTEVMAGVIIELARSADWATGVVFVNGHGGNVTAMQRAQEVFDVERRRVLIWWPRVPGGDPHAGRTETSLLQFLAPDTVRVDDAVAGPVPTLDELVRHGVRPLSESGVLGDPTGASADEGAVIFSALLDDLAEATAAAATRWTPSP